ncbi:uncharacterized protein LOC105198333 isoform X2 [Solenopsis invicta]|uniref:uncharacterized protein LOC105198333 isoform X2 n=1 Tax=Solenopsis invicta TaxID=13686 RepID=UPI00193CAA18|nr:uncharacterized protein LOC105198333 isoform X2 [Solenopsis invicta]
MNTSDIQHFNLNRILLLSIGLWPYNQSKLVLFQQILLFGLLISFVIYQLIIFFITEFTIGFTITVFSFILFYIAFIIEYNSFWSNGQAVKNLLEQFMHVCNELKDENEINVMKKYASNTKRYTTGMILIVLAALPITIAASIWPYILNIVKPKNESRSDFMIQLLTTHFADPDKYRYLMLLYMHITICIGGITKIATGTMLIGYLKYACGMFRIASYRIERAMAINNLHGNLENKNVTYKGIVYAVVVHRKAMELCKSLMFSFEGTFFALIAVDVLNLSLNLYRVFQSVSVGDNKEETIIHVIIVLITLLYMFLANYAGQEITDHNNHLFSTAYNVHWYIAPLHVQKLILFLLQMGHKTFGLNVNGLFTASLNCFASLANASISYFTVLYSTQKL